MIQNVESGRRDPNILYSSGSVFDGHTLLAEDFLNSSDPDEDADYLVNSVALTVEPEIEKRASILESVDQRLAQVRAALQQQSQQEAAA